MIPREPRRKVMIAARVRSADSWVGSLIRNISSSGMLLEMISPPPRGSFLQIARGKASIRGRVIWSAGRRCGVQTHQSITDEYLAGRAGEDGSAPPELGSLRDALLSKEGQSAGSDQVAVVPVARACSGNLRPARTDTGLLNDLKLAHSELLAAIVEMERATALSQPDARLCPPVRYRLSQASRARRVLVSTICSDLLKRAAAPEAEEIRVLKSDGIRQLLESASHVQAWTPPRIKENWPDYCEASAQIRMSMRARIEAEKAVLYPLLGEGP